MQHWPRRKHESANISIEAARNIQIKQDTLQHRTRSTEDSRRLFQSYSARPIENSRSHINHQTQKTSEREFRIVCLIIDEHIMFLMNWLWLAGVEEAAQWMFKD